MLYNQAEHTNWTYSVHYKLHICFCIQHFQEHFCRGSVGYWVTFINQQKKRERERGSVYSQQHHRVDTHLQSY